MNVRLVAELLFTAAILAGCAYLHVDRAYRKLREFRGWLTARA